MTPSYYLRPASQVYLNYSVDFTFLSDIGERQAYIIGRDLRHHYFERVKLNFRVFTSLSSLSDQTARGILRGFFLTGEKSIVPKHLQAKSIPPINNFNFTEMSEDMRDSSILNYADIYDGKLVLEDYEHIFHPDRTCSSVYKALQKEVVNCSEIDVSMSTCNNMEQFCTTNYKTTEGICGCLSDHWNFKLHKIHIRPLLKFLTVIFMKEKCNELTEHIFKGDLQKLMTEKFLMRFKDDLKEDNKATMYVVSLLQFKIIAYTLSSEFPTIVSDYGSLLTLERDFIDKDKSVLRLTLNKDELNEKDKNFISYEIFVNWVNNRQLESFP